MSLAQDVMRRRSLMIQWRGRRLLSFLGESMNHLLSLLMTMVALALFAGCQPVASSATTDTAHSGSVDPGDVPVDETDVQRPADYPAAVRRIETFRDAIQAAVESGDLEQAHHPLDEADFVLRWLPDIARDSGVPRRHWEQIVVASEDLNEVWGEIHSAIDAHLTPDYAVRQTAIDDALGRLQRVTRESQVSERKTPRENP